MSVQTQREMLEAAIAADFDDAAAHAAYADLLIEEGDPRGEYIRLRLALEDESQPPRLRALWSEQASRLSGRHQREWLGELARFLYGPEGRELAPLTPNIEFTWNRGWLATLDIAEVSDAFMTALARAPEARMLQALTCRSTGAPFSQNPLRPLLHSPVLANLRHFTYGDPDSYASTAEGGSIHQLLPSMPRLQHLSVRATGVSAPQVFATRFPHLESLAVDFLVGMPLRTLTGNPSLTRLERLFLWDREDPVLTVDLDRQERSGAVFENFIVNDLRPFLVARQFTSLSDLTLRTELLGDAGCREIARSGILGWIRRLDLRYCGITDAGAAALARSPDLRRLHWLDVGGNRLSMTGVNQLEAADIRVQWDSQWGEYLEPDHGGDAIV